MTSFKNSNIKFILNFQFFSTLAMSSEQCAQRLQELMRIPGNNQCADCGTKGWELVYIYFILHIAPKLGRFVGYSRVPSGSNRTKENLFFPGLDHFRKFLRITFILKNQIRNLPKITQILSSHLELFTGGSINHQGFLGHQILLACLS